MAAHPSPAPPLVRAPPEPHSAPRFLAYVEKELTDSSLTVSFKRQAQPLKTPAQFRTNLVEEIFCSALSHRLFKLSRRPDPPFYSAGCVSDDPVAAVNVFFLVSRGYPPVWFGPLAKSLAIARMIFARCIAPVKPCQPAPSRANRGGTMA